MTYGLQQYHLAYLREAWYWAEDLLRKYGTHCNMKNYHSLHRISSY
jgi:hypothetical protein